MAFKNSKSRVIIPIVEMTPMIDIVFLLIIFFMVAAQFAQQAHVNVSLPNEIGEMSEDKQQSTLVINILEDGSIIVDKTDGVVSLDEVDQLIIETISEQNIDWKNVTIRADQNTKASSLNKVLRLLSKHGLSATNIATEKP